MLWPITNGLRNPTPTSILFNIKPTPRCQKVPGGRKKIYIEFSLISLSNFVASPNAEDHYHRVLTAIFTPLRKICFYLACDWSEFRDLWTFFGFSGLIVSFILDQPESETHFTRRRFKPGLIDSTRDRHRSETNPPRPLIVSRNKIMLLSSRNHI